MSDTVALLSSAEKAKAMAIRHQLLEDIERENAAFSRKLQEFSADQNRDKKDYIDLARSVIVSVDNILGRTDYEESLFLRNAVRPLKRIREHAEALLTQYQEQQQTAHYTEPRAQKDRVPVYIHLFQSQGHKLENWERLLSSLGRYVLGRPIYKEEEDVKGVIRAKMSSEQEAYVVVSIPAQVMDSSNNASPRKDRFGNTLVTLPAGVIDPEQILEFVHGKKHYHFVKGELIDASSRNTEHE